MTLIRYQAPELASWSPTDRRSNLMDELNSFFECRSGRAPRVRDNFLLVGRPRSISIRATTT